MFSKPLLLLLVVLTSTKIRRRFCRLNEAWYILSKKLVKIYSNRIVKRGRSRLKNLLSALAIAAAAAAAVAAAILRTLTFEASLLFLDLFIKRLLMLTTVKALRCIKCINTLYAVFGMLKVAIATAPLLLPLLTPLSITSAVNSPSGLASRSKGFKSSFGSFASFAFALKTFNLNIAFIKLNGLVAANRSPMTRSASSISPFPALALISAAFVVLVAFAVLVAFVALIIVAFFALVVALAAFAAAPAVVMTFTERRAKVKRLLRALVDLLL
ncbi:hypothetical protein MBM_04080 [Drepanopeziza brunnea f. sp. 'multigermtubi' MB_m1]|uniref:Uncharacterized protein n=1 Tax=Marssonina brunnea f. sp. multigermtubi (strain MB_m1) TaxID=1072389 RepID=K1WXD4_MARBU|nr:uncharacterized protein MBM_04080 [Drepanopeziza brunnea f. sp. 'multigermtubi' MB_m1]EKD17711.1 hypothetical protein MBM_04080 [Drepanopeziza brunnea f. sp. 'multigermtubi' MB_m1]